MKTKCYILLLSVIAAIYGCSSKPSVPAGEFLISGKLTNVPDSAKISLYSFDGKLFHMLQTDTIINGEFSFRDTISTGKKDFLIMSNEPGFPGTWTDVVVAPGELIIISGEDKLIKTWKIESNIPEQKEINDFNKVGFPEQHKLMEYMVEEYDLFRLMYDKYAGNEDFRKEAWLKIDSLRTLREPLRNTISIKELDYLEKTPVSEVWMKKFSEYVEYMQYDKKSELIPKIKAIYEKMTDADRKTATGQKISEYMNLKQEVNVGEDMVDGDLYDLEGNLRHLSEFKGKYIMLDFWSMGCGPCVQSIPEMEEVGDMYKEKLAIISISEDKKDNWKEFVTDKKMTGNQWNELRNGRTGLAAQYQVKGIPHYVVISPEGKIIDIWSGYGPNIIKNKLNNLLKGVK